MVPKIAKAVPKTTTKATDVVQKTPLKPKPKVALNGNKQQLANAAPKATKPQSDEKVTLKGSKQNQSTQPSPKVAKPEPKEKATPLGSKQNPLTTQKPATVMPTKTIKPGPVQKQASKGSNAETEQKLSQQAIKTQPKQQLPPKGGILKKTIPTIVSKSKEINADDDEEVNGAGVPPGEPDDGTDVMIIEDDESDVNEAVDNTHEEDEDVRDEEEVQVENAVDDSIDEEHTGGDQEALEDDQDEPEEEQEPLEDGQEALDEEQEALNDEQEALDDEQEVQDGEEGGDEVCAQNDDDNESNEDEAAEVCSGDDDDESPATTAVGENAAKAGQLVMTYQNGLQISNLPDQFDDSDIKELFGKYGNVTSINRVTVSAADDSVKYVRICFETPEMAKAALATHQQAEINGSLINTVSEMIIPERTDRTVYVRNVHPTVTDSTLRKHFESCGEIDGIAYTRRGFMARIEFKEPAAKEKALELHNTTINGLLVTVRPMQARLRKDETHTITLRNNQLLKSADNVEICETFSKFGRVEYVDVRCRGTVLAFVTFAEASAAKAAFESMNGQKMGEVLLDIEMYKPITVVLVTTILVRNIKQGVDEQQLEALFKTAGPIVSVTLKKDLALVVYRDRESFCKAFLLEQSLVNGQMIFLEPYSKKKHDLLGRQSKAENVSAAKKRSFQAMEENTEAGPVGTRGARGGRGSRGARVGRGTRGGGGFNSRGGGGSSDGGGFAKRGSGNRGGFSKGGSFGDGGGAGGPTGGGFSGRGRPTDRGGFSKRGGFGDRDGPGGDGGGASGSRRGFIARGGFSANRGGFGDRGGSGAGGAFNIRGGLSNRGGFGGDVGGFGDRSGSVGGGGLYSNNRGGFGDRGGFSNRGGFGDRTGSGEAIGFSGHGGFSDRAGFGGGDTGGFSNLAGFPSQTGFEDRGDFSNRGSSGGRGGFNSLGGFGDRGGFSKRGGFNERGGFGDRGDRRGGRGGRGTRGGQGGFRGGGGGGGGAGAGFEKRFKPY